MFFFKQKTAYERRISDLSSDVCSSDLAGTPFWTVKSAHHCGFRVHRHFNSLRYGDRPHDHDHRSHGSGFHGWRADTDCDDHRGEKIAAPSTDRKSVV